MVFHHWPNIISCGRSPREFPLLFHLNLHCNLQFQNRFKMRIDSPPHLSPNLSFNLQIKMPKRKSRSKMGLLNTLPVISFARLLVQEDLQAFHVAQEGGVVQGRPAVVVVGANWFATLDQPPHHIRPGECSTVPFRILICVLAI